METMGVFMETGRSFMGSFMEVGRFFMAVSYTSLIVVSITR